jgi:hypothetical protein
MGLYIVMNKDQSDNKDQALIWILYNMEGKAANWATPIIDDITSNMLGAPVLNIWECHAHVAHRRLGHLGHTR